jgi:hypothetical protein
LLRGSLKRKALTAVTILVTAASCWADPRVDGKVSPGEYPHALSLVLGDVTVSYSRDQAGGLYLAVTAPTTGWVGIGLGSVVMDGAHIFMGFVKDGQPVISEQVGEGHSHHPSPVTWADQAAVVSESGATTLELHVPAGRVPGDGRKTGVIAAYSGSADLVTYHDDAHDGGYIDLSAPP